MGLKIFSLFLSCLLLKSTLSIDDRLFPESFKFGAATAAYQVEGGWDADGKGENIWDHISHVNPDFITNQNNADVAADSYHKYKEDVGLLKELGAHYYRFSISWSRIIPRGLAGSPINQAGIDYYKNLIQELSNNGIEAMVTLYHWDLPQTLQDIGGWPNPKLVDHFEYYARTVFENFGDQVKLWFTFNEPKQTCLDGYGHGGSAPAYQSPGIADYQCVHTVIKSHARAYRVYEAEFKERQGGRIGMVVDTAWNVPATDSDQDREAVERSLQFTYGWYANPIVFGNYPQVMIDRIDARSKAQGFEISRLPKFTDEEIEQNKGTADFVTLNIYGTVATAWQNDADLSEISYETDMGVNSQWTDPQGGMRGMVNWLKNTYNNPEIYITENGFARPRGVDDDDRIGYIRDNLSSLLEAILDDDVNVTRYTAWSLIDTFEWRAGYSTTLGLYEVDFDNPDRPRTAKNSAHYYTNVIKTRCLVDSCQS